MTSEALKKLNITAASIVCTLLLLISIIIIKICSDYTPQSDIYTLDAGWNITYTNKITGETTSCEDINLENIKDELDVTGFAKGDTLTFSYEFSRYGEAIDFPCIYVKFDYCAFYVNLDSETIYEYATNKISTGEFVACNYIIIPITSNYKGKTIEFHLTLTENTDLVIDAPLLGSSNEITYVFLYKNIFPFITGCFMITFGTVFALLSLVMLKKLPGMMLQLKTSLLSVLIGVRIWGYYELFPIIIKNEYSTTINFIALYLFVPVTMMIVREILPKEEEKKLFCTPVETFDFIAFLAACIFHFTNIIHFNRFLICFYVFTIVNIGIMVFYFVYCVKQKILTKYKMMHFSGLMIMSSLLIIDAIYYITMRFVYSTNTTTYLFPVGGFFYSGSIILNYLINTTRAYASAKENDRLVTLAYKDGLTNLSNKAMFDRILEVLDLHNDDYCIISIDLNELKEINDTYGHNAGDAFIENFASILTDVFTAPDYCCRVGGDEFSVTTANVNETDILNKIEKLNELTKALNDKNSEYKLSFAYGYAFKHEFDSERVRSSSVYMAADSRMYELKNLQHKIINKRRKSTDKN